jgi:hypothetical protein
VPDEELDDYPARGADYGRHKDSGRTVTLSRHTGTVTTVPGTRHEIALLIDAGHMAKRYHHLSFGRSPVLDRGTADFVANKCYSGAETR